MGICDTVLATIEYIAFTLFTPLLLGALSVALALIYLHKFFRNGAAVPRGHWGYTIKGFNWAVFAAAFFVFPLLPLETARALLRLSVSFLLLSELAYFWDDAKFIVREAGSWIRSQIS